MHTHNVFSPEAMFKIGSEFGDVFVGSYPKKFSGFRGIVDNTVFLDVRQNVNVKYHSRVRTCNSPVGYYILYTYIVSLFYVLYAATEINLIIFL